MPEPSGFREMRQAQRFPVEEVEVSAHAQGFLSKFGLKGGNRAKTAINLSEGGALLHLTRRLQPDQQIRLRVHVPKFDDTLECMAEVRWCLESGRDAGDYYAGVKFVDLPADAVRKITKMRSWFTSKEFKVRTSIRKKEETKKLTDKARNKE